MQVLGRANRIAPHKPPIAVLDFVNSAAEIAGAFRQFFDSTVRHSHLASIAVGDSCCRDARTSQRHATAHDPPVFKRGPPPSTALCRPALPLYPPPHLPTSAFLTPSNALRRSVPWRSTSAHAISSVNLHISRPICCR